MKEIIDSLQEFAGLMTDEDSAMRARFDKLADNIVTEYGKELRKQYDKGYDAGYDAGYDVGFASADDWLADNEAEMAEHGWVKLPVDADGEVIHIGDRVEDNERVVRIVLTDGSWEPSVYIEKLPNVLHEHFCNEISHYHAPTVEDVLREFGRGWHEQMNGPETFDIADYVERYAAKLRLAGDAE